MKLFTAKKEHLQVTTSYKQWIFRFLERKIPDSASKSAPPVTRRCGPVVHLGKSTGGWNPLDILWNLKGLFLEKETILFSTIKWFLNLKDIMYIDTYWHMCPLWYFHGRSCIPNASCRNLFLWDLEIFLLVLGSPILKWSWKIPSFVLQKIGACFLKELEFFTSAKLGSPPSENAEKNWGVWCFVFKKSSNTFMNTFLILLCLKV